MSGTPCLIIIRGNRAQANTRFAVADMAFHGATQLLAEQLIGGFQSLCQFGGTYDAVMTPAQQQASADLMGAYNDVIESLLLDGPKNRAEIASQIRATQGAVYQLLDAVSQNP